MLLLFARYLATHIHAFHVFNYLTLRSICATLTGLLISLLMGPKAIRYLQSLQIGQQVRDDGPQSHLSKAGTPTMGGAFIVIAIALSTLLWADLTNPYIWISLFLLFSFGLIGWVDDYKKVVLKNSKGLSVRSKLSTQLLSAGVAVIWMFVFVHGDQGHLVVLPFIKSWIFDLGWLWIAFAVLVIVGSSNAVNLTDGLDGLAIMPTVMIAATLGVFVYVSGNTQYAKYLSLPFVQGAGELCIYCGAIVGAGLGFLWYNTYPAEVFMGDVGSLTLGAALGVIALSIHQSLMLFIMGGLFVAETLSVMLQVGYFKLTQERIFRMAPLHHHFELKGWSEPKVVVRFWMVTFVLVLISLATLKLR